MSRSDGGLRFGRRLKAKLLGELPIWGLKTPARLSWEDGAAIDCAEQDRDLVHGFAAAAAAMPAMPPPVPRRTGSSTTRARP